MEIIQPLVFVLDDDPDFRNIIQLHLKNLGLRTELFSTPEDFLSRLRDVQPDICLIDLNIGGQTVGLAMIKAIRTKLGAEIPLFVVSGNAEPERIAHAVEIGATDYIVKPVDRDLLASKLVQFITSPELKQGGLPFFSAPPTHSAVEFSLEFQIETIDEVGLTLISPHLLMKGAQVQLKGKWIQEVTGEEQVNCTVVSTRAITLTKDYAAYAEFDQSNEEVLTKIRTWLARNPSIFKPAQSEQ